MRVSQVTAVSGQVANTRPVAMVAKAWHTRRPGHRPARRWSSCRRAIWSRARDHVEGLEHAERDRASPVMVGVLQLSRPRASSPSCRVAGALLRRAPSAAVVALPQHRPTHAIEAAARVAADAVVVGAGPEIHAAVAALGPARNDAPHVPALHVATPPMGAGQRRARASAAVRIVIEYARPAAAMDCRCSTKITRRAVARCGGAERRGARAPRRC